MAIIISPILFSIVARNKNQKHHLVSENLTNETKNTLKDLFSSVAQNMWVQGSLSPFPCAVPGLYVIHDNSRLLLCFSAYFIFYFHNYPFITLDDFVMLSGFLRFLRL